MKRIKNIARKGALYRWLVMAGSVVILSLFCFTDATAQGVRFDPGDGTLGGAIAAIEAQTGHLFIYNASLVDVARRVELPAGEVPLSDVLAALEPQIGYRILLRQKYLVIHTAEPYRPKTAASPVPRTRASDGYTPIGAELAGVASHPRPVREDPQVVSSGSGDIPAVEESPAEAAPYSTSIDLYRYSPVGGRLPLAAVKVNVLYGAVAYTPNLAVELGAGARGSVEASFSHNRWKHKADLDDNRKLMHWIARGEYRRWLCERFDGHYVGAHIFYGGYNISGKNVPLLFKSKYRYKGFAVGGGVTYGYHWAFARRWGAEFNFGLGAAYLDYDRYGCRTCDRNAEPKTRVWFGPTRAGVNLVFMIR